MSISGRLGGLLAIRSARWFAFALALFLVFWLLTSLGEAAGLIASCALIACGVRLRGGRQSLFWRVPAALIGAFGVWFIAVDMSHFVERCEDCGEVRFVVQYRVLRFPVAEWSRTTLSPINQVARILGIECPHHGLTRWQKCRYWGLLICADPCWQGIYALSGKWTPEDERATTDYIQKARRDNPNLSSEFYKRVFVEHDLAYWRQMMDKVAAAAESDKKQQPK